MSDTTARNRVPAGVTTGGQFATEAKQESAVALAPQPAGLRLMANGHVDGTDLPSEVRPWAAAVESLIRTRKRVAEARAASLDHRGALLREAIQARAMAVMLTPSLAGEESLVSDRLSKVAGRLMRSHNLDIAEMPVPEPMTDEERAAAVRMFARAAVVESRSRFGSPDGPDACLEAAAAFGAGDDERSPVVADAIADDLRARAHERREDGEVLSEDDALDVVNAWRRRLGLEQLL